MRANAWTRVCGSSRSIEPADRHHVEARRTRARMTVREDAIHTVRVDTVGHHDDRAPGEPLA